MKKALKIIGLILKLSLLTFVVSFVSMPFNGGSTVVATIWVASICSVFVLSFTYVICLIIKSFI